MAITRQQHVTPTPMRRRRQEMGLSILRLAILAEVEPSAISRIERGLGRPGAAVALRIWRALGSDLALLPSILGDAPEAPQAAEGT